MKIYEPEPGDQNKNVSVTVEVPLKIYLHGTRTDENYKNVAVETLRNHASAIFDHVALVGFLAEEHEWDYNILHPLLDTLGRFGAGLMEACEQVEMDFERKSFEYDPPRQKEEPASNVTVLKAA